MGSTFDKELYDRLRTTGITVDGVTVAYVQIPDGPFEPAIVLDRDTTVKDIVRAWSQIARCRDMLFDLHRRFGAMPARNDEEAIYEDVVLQLENNVSYGDVAEHYNSLVRLYLENEIWPEAGKQYAVTILQAFHIKNMRDFLGCPYFEREYPIDRQAVINRATAWKKETGRNTLPRV
jgi:hypothetical protein